MNERNSENGLGKKVRFVIKGPIKAHIEENGIIGYSAGFGLFFKVAQVVEHGIYHALGLEHAHYELKKISDYDRTKTNTKNSK